MACLVLLATAMGTSRAAVLRFGNLVVHAEGRFTPQKLPRHGYAPIEIEGRGDIRTVSGGAPPPLKRVVLEFDRDGKLTTTGLAVCQASQIEGTTVKQARHRCARAIVGEGTLDASVLIEGRWVKVTSPLTIFNGPPEGAYATVLAHAQPVSLPGETYVVSVPIVRTAGVYRYRATVEIPEIFNPTGTLTHVEARIGRRYRFHGHRRSYVSARCSHGTLAVHGEFTWADGTIVSGSIEKPCTATH